MNISLVKVAEQFEPPLTVEEIVFLKSKHETILFLDGLVPRMTDPEELKILARHRKPSVRHQVEENPNTSPAIAAQLRSERRREPPSFDDLTSGFAYMKPRYWLSELVVHPADVALTHIHNSALKSLQRKSARARM